MSTDTDPFATLQRLVRERADASRNGVFEIDDVPSPRPAVEHYLRVSVDVPGGCVEAALQRTPGEPLRPLRIQLADLIAEEALALNGDDLCDDNAGRLSDAMQARFASVWPGRAWWAELWLTGEVEDPLTQFYAPWGRPRWR